MSCQSYPESALAGLGATINADDDLVIKYRPSQAKMDDILRAVKDTGIEIIDLATQEADLEDVFRHLTRAV